MRLFFFIIPLLYIFYPILFKEKIFSGGYVFNGFYPMFYQYSNILKCCNQISTWFASYLGGFPILLTQGFGFLHPLSIVFFKFFDYILVYNWLVVFNGFLAAFFTYLLARELNLSRAASSIAGSIFLFNGLVIQWLPLLAFGYLFPLYPLVFLLLLKIYNESPRINFKYAGLLILVITVGWVSAFTETVLYLVLAVIAFAIFLDFGNIDNSSISIFKSGLFKKFKILKHLFLILLASSLFASVWILPVYQFTKLSPRSAGLDMETAYQGSAHWGDYFAIFNFKASLGDNASSVFYIGIFSIFLVLFSIFLFRKNKFVKFFWILFLITFIIIMPNSPLLWILHQFPPFSWFRGGFKYFFLGHLSLAILAGFGLDAVQELKDNLAWNKFVSFLKWIFLIFIAGIISFRFIFYGVLNFVNDSLLIGGWHDKIFIILDKFYRHSLVFNFYSILTIVFFSIFFVLIYLYQNNKISLQYFKVIILIFISLNMVFFWKDYYARGHFISDDYLREIPQAAVLLNGKLTPDNLFRITRFSPSQGYSQISDIDQYELSKQTIAPNLNIIYGLDSINAFEEGMMTSRQTKIFEQIDSESVSLGGLKDRLKNMSYDERLVRFNSDLNIKLLSMMNVKYALSIFELGGNWTEVSMVDSGLNIPVRIYENKNVLPRVYFAEKVKYIDDSEEVVFQELLLNNNFKMLTLVECSDCGSNLTYLTEKDVNVIEIKDGYIKLKTNTDNSGWLVLSELYLHGWTAKINNKVVDIKDRKSVV